MPRELGDFMYVSGFWVTGDVNINSCGALIEDIVQTIRMEKAHGSTVFSYPVEGKGGEGHTIVQPITTSIIIIDIWPKAEVPHAFLLVCSCQHFNSGEVQQSIENAGFDSLDHFDQSLSG